MQRHIQPSLHVTEIAKLSLPVQVELEPADSVVVDGERAYSIAFVSAQMLIIRETGCLLEKLRYRFYDGGNPHTEKVLSPRTCRNDFLRDGATLRQCNAGLSLQRVGRWKNVTGQAVRPPGNPIHSWALGLYGVAGSFVMVGADAKADSTRSITESALDKECSGWRALLRDALQVGYADWPKLAQQHPAAWVNELLAPLPLTIESCGGAPMARVVCQSLLDVLIVTTQLDGIQGLRYRVCKADGCGELFEVKNYDHKIFCDYDCAHRQAVRDGRRRKREALEKAPKNSMRTATKERKTK